MTRKLGTFSDPLLDRQIRELLKSGVTTAEILALIIGKLEYQHFNVIGGTFPIASLGELPTLPSTTYPPGAHVFLTTVGKLYRNVANVWTTAVATSDLSGQILSAQIADAAVSTTKFANGIEPVGIVGALPNPAGYTGVKTVLLTTDGKLYRYSSGAWTAAIPAGDISGQITTTQITDSAITSDKINANAVTTGKLAAGAVTANEIAANTITSGKIAVGAISATELSAGAVTAGKIAASAIVANDGVIANAAIANAHIIDGTIQSAKIASLVADKITTGTLDAANVNVANFSANKIVSGVLSVEKAGFPFTYWGECSGIASDFTTINLLDASRFPASGSGNAISLTSSTCSKFAWTGKSGNVLTGVTGLSFQPTQYDLIAQDIAGTLFTPSTYSALLRVMADIDNDTSYTSHQPIFTVGGSGYCGVFGSTYNYRTGTSGSRGGGVAGYAHSHIGVYGESNTEYGVVAKGIGKGPLRIIPSSSADAPTHTADIGTLWATSAGVLYINTSGSTTWTKVGAQ